MLSSKQHLHSRNISFVSDSCLPILCLTLRMTVTSACIPEEDACYQAHNLCAFSRIHKRIPGLTHKRYVLHCLPFGALSCVTVILEMRQSIIVMWSSKISRKSEILILRYSQTEEVFPFVSFCFGNSLIADIFWTGCSISMGFSAKCSLANACYIPIRNWKLNMTDFRLILLDHTTYVEHCLSVQ